MNVIDFLLEDHRKFREELSSLRTMLQASSARDRMWEFIGHMELHESVEDRISKAITEKYKSQEVLDLAEEIDKEHDRAWALLDDTMEALKAKKMNVIKQSFFNFQAQLLAHMMSEEEKMFPKLRKSVPGKELEELGDYAVKFYMHAKGDAPKP